MKAFVKGLVYLAIAAVFVVSLFFAFKQELFAIRAVDISITSEKVDDVLFDSIEDDMQPTLKAIQGKWMWDINLDTLLEKIFNDKRVKTARVARRLPGRVQVYVEAHLPVAILLKGKNTFIPVARDGSLLPSVPLKEVLNSPILRGKNFSKDAKLRASAVEYLSLLPEDGSLTLSEISEVHWTKRQGLTLYMQKGGTQVLLGQNKFLDKTESIQKVLNYLNKEGMRGRVIDARFSKKVVVKLRNES